MEWNDGNLTKKEWVLKAKNKTYVVLLGNGGVTISAVFGILRVR